MLVLELVAMVVRLFRPFKLAGVHGDRWTVCIFISIDVRVPLGACFMAFWALALEILREAGDGGALVARDDTSSGTF